MAIGIGDQIVWWDGTWKQLATVTDIQIGEPEDTVTVAADDGAQFILTVGLIIGHFPKVVTV